MALNLEGKKAVVAEVSEVANSAFSAVAAEYRGLSVSEMTELRVAARKENVYLRVIRNTLARRAVEGTDFACLQEGMTGPLVFGFSMEKKIDDVRSQLIEKLAKMPTKEQAISMFMGTLKAPIEKFVRTLQAPTSKMVRTFAAVRDAKDAA